MKPQPLLQSILLILIITILAIIIAGCNGTGGFNPLKQLTQDEIEVTVELGQPIPS